MRTITARLKSVTQYQQSKPYQVERKDQETHDEYEKRTWQNRLHVDDKGEVFIPNTAFKNALDDAAAFLSEKIKGQGQKTYTKRFKAGVLVPEPVGLGMKASDTQRLDLFVPSDGRRGGGSRVWKSFPIVPEWEADVVFIVLDGAITNEVFERHLIAAGKFIGIGAYRPQSGGYQGRFSVESLNVETDSEA